MFFQIQLDFRKNIQHLMLVLISLEIVQNLGEENIGCGIFADLQKPFDTVEHDIFIKS